MSLIHQESFDSVTLSDAVLSGRFTQYNGAGSGVSITTPGRFGTGGFYTNNDTGSEYLITKDFGNQSDVIIEFAYRSDTALGNKQIMTFLDASNTGVQGALLLTTSGELKVVKSTAGTQLGISAAGVIVAGIWYWIEIRYKTHNTLGELDFRLNGVNLSGLNGITGLDSRGFGSNNYINRVGLISGTGGNSFDDLYIMTPSGGTLNAFTGELRIETIRPNAVGSDTDFTRSTGATNWGTVDETAPSDVDYNYSPTPGSYDLFGLTNLPTSGPILSVAITTRAAKDDVTTRTLKNCIKVASDPVTDCPSTLSLSTTAQYVTDIYELNPSTAAAFTATEINSGIETGYKIES